MRRRLQRYVWVGVLPVFGGMFAVLNGKLGAAGTARPLSIAPVQGEWLNVSHQAEVEKHRAGGKREKAKSGGGYPGQGVGRMQKSWPEKGAATSRPPPRWGSVGGC